MGMELGDRMAQIWSSTIGEGFLMLAGHPQSMLLLKFVCTYVRYLSVGELFAFVYMQHRDSKN